jgi:hypothetical protein
MDQLVDEQIRPHFAYVRRVMTDLLGPGADDRAVRLCCTSVVGQCLFYHFAQPVTRRLFGRPFGMADADDIARHVTQLTLNGVRAMATHGRASNGSAAPRNRVPARKRVGGAP